MDELLSLYPRLETLPLIVVPGQDEDMIRVVRAFPRMLHRREKGLKNQNRLAKNGKLPVQFVLAAGSHAAFYEYQVNGAGVLIQIAIDSAPIVQPSAMLITNLKFYDYRVNQLFCEPFHRSASLGRELREMKRIQRSLFDWMIGFDITVERPLVASLS